MIDLTNPAQTPLPLESRPLVQTPLPLDKAVDAGDRVEFVEIGRGQFLFMAANRSVTELKGMFGKSGKTATIEDMNEVIAARGAAAR